MPVFADRQFVRRIAAVLVAEHESVDARSTGQIVGAAVEMLRDAGGDAEPLAPNALVAVFDQPRAAVEAAMRVHLQAAGETPVPWRGGWRAGLNVVEVTMTVEGTALRDAIDRAIALARVAQAGTTAVMTEVVSALGRLSDAEIVDADTDDPAFAGRVSLVVPRWSRPVLERRRLVRLLVGTAAVGGAGVVAWTVANRMLDEEPERHVTLGVGPFHASGPEQTRAWVGRAMRDGLNTQLSELSGVRVFSDEFIDFLMTRESLTSIQAASKLGIEKMVTGSVILVGDTVRVEVRIVDVPSGVFEGGHVVSGREQDFLVLESDLVHGVIAKLGLQLTAAEEDRLAARRATDLDALRRVLGAEGETQPAGTETIPGAEPGPNGRSWILDHLGPSEAQAADADASIAAFLEQFRRHTEARDVGALAAMYVAFPPEQRDALERYFAGVRELRVQIDRVETAVAGDEAVVSYRRTDDFVDLSTNRLLHVAVRLTKTLRRVDGSWRFAQ